MRLKNTTNISTDLIREIIRFVKPNSVNNVRVDIKPRKRQASGIGGSGEVIVKIADPKTFKFPYETCDHGAYIGIRCYTYEEVLVQLLAHELRHCWQTIHRKGYRYYGSKGVISERDADCYALHMLREWRRR